MLASISIEKLFGGTLAQLGLSGEVSPIWSQFTWDGVEIREKISS